MPIHVQEVNQAVQELVFRALDKSIRYYVCFDQLDLGFSPGNKDYEQRLIGLLLAAKDVFNSAKEARINLNPAVFLRDDIYQDLSFEDKNKITKNYTSRLTWAESEKFTLKELMERRFSAVLGADAPLMDWSLVFDESKEMPGRQTKYIHICDRTLLRPRDMIEFCNEVLRCYNAENQSNEKFSNEVVHQARDRYSEYLLDELDDEVGKHWPEYKDYLEAIKRVGSKDYTLDAFAAKMVEVSENFSMSPQAALERFFEFSIIGYLKPGGRGGGSQWVWRYKDNRARFDAQSDRFRVHPGLKEVLGLVQGKAAARTDHAEIDESKDLLGGRAEE